MNAPVREKLYSPTLLGLATELAQYPMDDAPSLKGEAHSRTCGSSVKCGLSVGSDGRVERLGLQASACAVGQAAAAIFAASAKGKSSEEIAASHDAIAAWLAEGADTPDWPGIEALEPALSFPARHAAILLAWKAASQALSKAESSR